VTDVEVRPRRSFDRSRLRLGIVFAVVLGAMVFLLVQGLDNATSFYRNADEAVAMRDQLGTKRFRLQGVVVPGSIKEVGDDVTFGVEYNCVTVPVHHTGTRPPTLFKNGIPVVLEGAFAKGADTFESDSIIVRHTSEYRTKESQKAEATEKERCST
jgi:cytochrome c-type biogenesis protein CcmE